MIHIRFTMYATQYPNPSRVASYEFGYHRSNQKGTERCGGSARHTTRILDVCRRQSWDERCHDKGAPQLHRRVLRLHGAGEHPLLLLLLSWGAPCQDSLARFGETSWKHTSMPQLESTIGDDDQLDDGKKGDLVLKHEHVKLELMGVLHHTTCSQ
jgi:hypothetical protein